ncbi:hypothetical protein BN6_66990 [Saccharothrix espanaensis DSM 44229]|uniref:Uncharacterized protein n=2 Tax=Saccharothrix espanaensis TaxID=103731 RepID=K0K6H3_SACES|nr:hypothetical protein BN6_66990 [Saccharothrix espanaensis DSM 44229]
MTYPNSGRPENQPQYPLPDQYGTPGPATTAPQPAAPLYQPTDQGFQPTDQGFQPAEQVFQPAVQLPAGPEFQPTGQSAPAGPPPVPPRKKTGLIVLSVLAVVFFATAGVFGVLYAEKVSENDRVSTQLADKEKELTDSGTKLKDAQDEASKAKDAAQIAETGRKRAEDDGAGMVKCRDAARALREAIFAKDEGRADKAFLDVVANC